MDITNTIHPAHPIDHQRQQFVPLGQDTISKALGSAQIEHILQDEVGPQRLRKNLSYSLENQAARQPRLWGYAAGGINPSKFLMPPLFACPIATKPAGLTTKPNPE